MTRRPVALVFTLMVALGWTLSAQALMAMPEVCTSDEDCLDGQLCLMKPCPTTICDPDDANCDPEPCPEEGECVWQEDDPWGGWESECEEDADCPAGFACVEGGWATIADAGTACVCPDGVPEEECDCPEPEEDPAMPEVIEVYMACEPKDCEVDSDCGDDLLCVLVTEECAGVMVPTPDCPPGAECPEPEAPEPCEPETYGMCAPTWLAPCETDSDCGEGFACIPEEVCWCSGSGGTGSSGGVPGEPGKVPPPEPGEDDGGDDDSGGAPMPEPVDEDEDDPEDPAEPDCGCEPTGQNICQLEQMDCGDDGDCMSGWTCLADYAKAAPCWMDSDGNTNCPESSSPGEPTDVAKACFPPDYEAWASSGGYGGGTATGLAESSPDPQAPVDDGDTAGGGSSGGGGGCQGSGLPTGSWMLVLLSLVAVMRRRP